MRVLLTSLTLPPYLLIHLDLHRLVLLAGKEINKTDKVNKYINITENVIKFNRGVNEVLCFLQRIYEGVMQEAALKAALKN